MHPIAGSTQNYVGEANIDLTVATSIKEDSKLTIEKLKSLGVKKAILW